MGYVSSAVFVSVVLFVFLGTFALVPAILMLSRDGERREEARLRREGIRAQAIIKTFLRRSMTQHRVLLEIRLPTGSTGRELLAPGLADDWLAHHAALGIPVPVLVDPSGSRVAFDRPSEGKVRTVTQSAIRALLLMGSVLLGCAVLGTGTSIVTGQMERASDEAGTPADVLRLREAFDRAGLAVARMQPHHAKETGVDLLVFVTFESDTSCLVRVHSAAATASLAPDPAERYNGRLSFTCRNAAGADVPRILAAFTAFRP